VILGTPVSLVIVRVDTYITTPGVLGICSNLGIADTGELCQLL
jgi:hypothetical protein